MSRKEIFARLEQSSNTRDGMLVRARQRLSSVSREDGEPQSRLLKFATSKKVLAGGAVFAAGGVALSGADLNKVLEAPPAVFRNIFDAKVVHADDNPNYISNEDEPNPAGPPTVTADSDPTNDLPL